MPLVADLRVVMRGEGFRRLVATRLTSQAGDGAFQVGLASLFFFSPERQTDAGGAALAFAVALLPYTLVGPFAGVLLDRWRRQRVLVVVNVVRALAVVGVAALVAGGAAGPLLVLPVLACLSVNRFFLSGLGASLPHVVPPHELVVANAVAPTAGTVAAVLGGAAGFGVRSALGASDRSDALVLLLAAGAYGVAAGLATRLGPDQLGPDGRDDVRTADAVRAVARGLAAGARHVRDRRPAFHALAAIGAHRFAYGLSTIATILLCRNYFNDPSDVDAGLSLLALVFGVSGVGFAVAAVVTPLAVPRIPPWAWVTVCFAAAAAAEYVFVAFLSAALLLVGAGVLGVAAQGAKICVDSLVQQHIDDAYRGRVFSLYDVVFNAAFLVAAAVAALIVPADGYSPLLYGGIATTYAVAALAYSRAARAWDRLSPPAPAGSPTS